MKINLLIAFAIALTVFLHGCGGGSYYVVNDLTTPCSNGSMPIVENSKGMIVCSK